MKKYLFILFCLSVIQPLQALTPSQAIKMGLIFSSSMTALCITTHYLENHCEQIIKEEQDKHPTNTVAIEKIQKRRRFFRIINTMSLIAATNSITVMVVTIGSFLHLRNRLNTIALL